MATVSAWNPFGVSLNITATAGTVTRKSATQYTVVIYASWETYYSGNKTNYGMTASSGGGSATINPFGTKASSGSGSFTGTYSISGNGSATKSITVTFKNFNSDNNKSATKTVTFNVTVPAWTSYIVKYDANGGSGAPGQQTKWKDQTLTLSSTKPTRTGYSFLGWSTSSTATSATYSAGGSYTANSGATLYAVWKANTYKVTYNANNGSGAPSEQTKTYGVALTLSSVIPTRTYYNFLGWSTSATATTATYKAGGSYTNNAAITLYAVWELAYVKPRINNLEINRCIAVDETYELSEEGTYALVEFDWATDKECQSIDIEWKSSTETTYANSVSIPGVISRYSGKVVYPIGGDAVSDEDKALLVSRTYTVRITVRDSANQTITNKIVSGSLYPIDVLLGGYGVSFGKSAELEDAVDFGWLIYPRAGYMYPTLEAGADLNSEEYRIPNKYIMKSVQNADYKYGGVSIPITSGTGMLTIESFGPDGQVKQTMEVCHKTNALRFERYYYQTSWGDWYEAGGYKSTITATISGNKTVGVVNTYTMIPFWDYRYIKKGSGLTVTEDGYIQIGEGIQRVMLSAQMKIHCGSTAGNRHARLCINSGGTVKYIAWSHIKMAASDQNAITFPPIMTSVSKNDLIYVVFYTPDASDAVYAGNDDNGAQTYMTVESI